MRRWIIWLLTALVFIFCFTCVSETVPYQIPLSGNTPIHKGPGDHYAYRQDVGEDGVFTIVEEINDVYGRVWGRLKSGLGWVCVSDEPVLTFRETPYAGKLPAWASIFDGPGYDFAYTKLVGMDGVYTIVEEVLDDDGNVWGKLKSGAGWVDLTGIKHTETLPAIISFADEELLESGRYIFQKADPSEYSVKIAIRANDLVKDPVFTSMTYEETYWMTDKRLYSAWRLRSTKPLVIEVTFWGDMTSFGFGYTDEYGIERAYMISISGRNGFLEVTEYYEE